MLISIVRLCSVCLLLLESFLFKKDLQCILLVWLEIWLMVNRWPCAWNGKDKLIWWTLLNIRSMSESEVMKHGSRRRQYQIQPDTLIHFHCSLTTSGVEINLLSDWWENILNWGINDRTSETSVNNLVFLSGSA